MEFGTVSLQKVMLVMVAAKTSIELVLHAACIRVRRIVHFQGGRSLSSHPRPESQAQHAAAMPEEEHEKQHIFLSVKFSLESWECFQ